MRLNPVVNHQADVFRDSDVQFLPQPVRDVGVEGDDRVGTMLLEPGAEDVGLLSEVVLGKQQERHPVLGGNLLLEIEHGAGVRVVRAGVDPLGHRQADALVPPCVKFGRRLENAPRHVGAGAVEGGILQAIAEGGGGEARVVELGADILRRLRRDDQPLDPAGIQNLNKPLGSDAALTKKKLLGTIAVLFGAGANISCGDILIRRIVKFVLGDIIADDGDDGFGPAPAVVANARHELGNLGVGAIAKFFDGGLHSPPGGGADMGRVVEHARHRHSRDLGGGRDGLKTYVVRGGGHAGRWKSGRRSDGKD